jgi:hypothetical protein
LASEKHENCSAFIPHHPAPSSLCFAPFDEIEKKKQRAVHCQEYWMRKIRGIERVVGTFGALNG